MMMAYVFALLLWPVPPVEGETVYMVSKWNREPIECHVEYGLIGLQAKGLKLVFEREDGGKGFYTYDKTMLFFRR